MATVTVSNATAEALESIARKNFRTVDLQIAYWLSLEGGVSERVATSKPIAPRMSKPGKPKGGWTEQQREAQRERMRAMWASGKMRKDKSLDIAAAGNFDD
jgi:hypothetical protein